MYGIFIIVKDFLIKLLYGIISILDKKNRSINKIIGTHNVSGIRVMTPEGWSKITHIHQTRPFERYIIKTENEFIECADDHIMYSLGREKYAREFVIGDTIDTINGSEIITDISIDYNRVSMCDVTVDNISHTYYANNILSHNTTTTAIFALHYMLFNVDKNTLILGNSRKTSIEILEKLKKIFIELPFFLRPGVYKWNEAEIVFDNGCATKGAATTPTVMLGMSISNLIWDEAAFVPPNIIDKFYNNMFPVLAATKGRLAISSTQNGYNLFYRLWTAACAGENDFKPFLITWDMIPEWNTEKKCWEKRDEAWHQRQVANYGSEEAFNAQFGTNFDISANTLIAQKILNKRRQRLVNFVSKDLYGVSLADHFIWHPDYEPMEQLRKDSIIITVDLAEGTGNDYITYAINRLKDPGSGKIECIGMFRANNVRREDCTLALQLLCCYYCDFNKLLISFEKNTYGEIFLRQIYDGIENHPIISQKFDPGVLVKYYTNEKKTNFTTGIKVTPGNKTAYCIMFKESYEKDLIINDSSLYMTELDKFCDDGTGHFKASFGHDDMVMALIQLEFVKATLQYKFMKEMFDSQTLKEDEVYYNPFDDRPDWMKDFDAPTAGFFETPQENTLESRLNRFG